MPLVLIAVAQTARAEERGAARVFRAEPFATSNWLVVYLIYSSKEGRSN